MKKLFLLPMALAALACASDTVPEDASVAVEATVETVESSTIANLREAPGSVQAALSAELASKALGNVKAIHVREGERVRAGQLLLEIDAAELDAQVARARAAGAEVESAIAGAEAALAGARANHAVAKSTWERFRALRERNSVSAQEFDEVEARYRGAEAELARASRGVEQARAKRDQAAAESVAANAMSRFGRIHAPFAGVVARKYVDPGAQAAPGMPLLRVDADHAFRFEAAVDDALASTLATGTPVGVRIGGTERLVRGAVAEVVPAVDPATRTSIVKIAIEETAGIRAGMYGAARIPSGSRAAITIPLTAVARRGQLETVWVVDGDGKARLRLVRTGPADGERVEILAGLAEGERVVVGGAEGVAEGVTIRSGGAQG